MRNLREIGWKLRALECEKTNKQMKSLTEWHFRKHQIIKKEVWLCQNVSRGRSFHQAFLDEQNGVSFMFLSTLQPNLLPKMWFWLLLWPWPWPLTFLSENLRFVIFCVLIMYYIQNSVLWYQFMLFSLYHIVTLAKFCKILTPLNFDPYRTRKIRRIELKFSYKSC